MRPVLVMLPLTLFLVPWAGAALPSRTGSLNTPYLEWSIEWQGTTGNPHDVIASVEFTDPDGARVRTPMFYGGNDQWRFRFTGIRVGTWKLRTDGPGDLGGHAATVEVRERSGGRANGFMTHFASKWGWQGTQKAFVPQYVMGKDLDAYYDDDAGRVDEAKIERDIRKFIVEHGFTGFHLQGRGRWFSLVGRPGKDPNPDPRTYEVLETIIRKVYERGGACHIWMWGKDIRRDGDGPRAMVGGPMTAADQRNLRYLAARLGPIPGWSIGYGYDTENLWASPEELDTWKEFLHGYCGWHHFIGARVGFDEKGPYGEFGKGIPKPPLNDKYNAPVGDEYAAWLGGSYTGYTSYRPLYDRYVEGIEHRPNIPSFEEDRFRLREAPQWTHKDYSPKSTIKGLWHSAMAGGVANIWGNLLPNDDQGGSQSYDHGDVDIKHLIKTYATFFRDKKRFRKDFIRDNTIADPRKGTTEVPAAASISVCLRNRDMTHLVFYKEDAVSVGMDLSAMKGPRPAVAVDAHRAYKEIDLGVLAARKQAWRAPYPSTWAIAVGRFD